MNGQPVNPSKQQVLPTEQLFKLINKQRRDRNRPPVEHSAMAARCGLRFNVGRDEPIDFTQPEIRLSLAELPALEQLLSEQFNVDLNGVLVRIYSNRAKPAKKPLETARQVEINPPKASIRDVLKRLFGGA